MAQEKKWKYAAAASLLALLATLGTFIAKTPASEGFSEKQKLILSLIFIGMCSEVAFLGYSCYQFFKRARQEETLRLLATEYDSESMGGPNEYTNR